MLELRLTLDRDDEFCVLPVFSLILGWEDDGISLPETRLRDGLLLYEYDADDQTSLTSRSYKQRSSVWSGTTEQRNRTLSCNRHLSMIALE
jgi:hypothetical protein